MFRKNKKAEHPTVKIVKNLIKRTTVPREKSEICWDRDFVFGQAYYSAEYKSKVYKFDGRHFYVYPAGHELPPGVSIGDRKGPDILLSIRIDAMPGYLGALWDAIEMQYEKEIDAEKRTREKLIKDICDRDALRAKQATDNAIKILDDFNQKP